MESWKTNINGIKFLLRKWQIKDAVACVFLVHGYAEHSKRYTNLAFKLNEAGYNVYAYDRRGEGQTEGIRAYIKSYDTQIEDLIAIKEMMVPEELPCFLYGHSMGGLILVKYLIDYQPDIYKGVILSGPLMKVDDNISPILQKLAGIVSAIAPRFKTTKIDSTHISRDPIEVKKYNEDPLVYSEGTRALTGHNTLKTTTYVQANFHKISIPLLIMHGGADKLSDPIGSKTLFQKASSQDKTIKVFDGWYHEIMREPNNEEFFVLFIQWMDAR